MPLLSFLVLGTLEPCVDGTDTLALAPSIVATRLNRLYLGTTMLTGIQPALTILESIDRPAQP